MSGEASRRDVLCGLLVAFSLAPSTALAQTGGGEGSGGPPTIAPDLPGTLAKFPDLDAWIRIAPDGRVTVFTGKVELGTGVKTAMAQLAADELDVAIDRIDLITADTGLTPNEGVTAGSQTLEQSGAAIANAAANVRLLLAEAAATRWGVMATTLFTRDGSVLNGQGKRATYAELAASISLAVRARADVPRKRREARRLIGRPVPRVDLSAKLTGLPSYVHDMRLPGMVHARVLRGPSSGTQLTPDLSALRRQPGVARVVQVGRFAAIVGPREWPLEQALRVANRGRWVRDPSVPALFPMPAGLLDMRRESQVIDNRRDNPGARGVQRLSARYDRPYLMHGAIGPSCAVALFAKDQLTVWTHSQGVEPLRQAIAELLAIPADRVRCVHREGAGCYGHNGADDVAGDAALIARAMPGVPVRLQWSREQEHGWEPLGPAMVAQVDATLDASGRIVDWRHQVWSNTHSTRPVAAGDLLAGAEVVPSFKPTPPKPIPQPNGGGDRNAIPLYRFPNQTIVSHFLPDMPVRVSALRGLGAHLNIFALESFMDELAAAAGKDPVAFRLAHLDDPRAAAVIRQAAARFGWARYRSAPNRGRGFAFARYKTHGAYCAIALDVEHIPDEGRLIVHRAVAAVDSGEAVNPDGIRNKVEGGIVQSLSWTAFEAAGRDGARRTDYDWSTYPILRFADAPRSVTVEVIDRPGTPFLGTGECAQGPTAAALANALASATGGRLRSMPLIGRSLPQT
ncbi:aldehyde dehydrogenase [Sphingomonas sp. Leaf208]|uniref:molybdopterin cofactor-binding domain-containing protein n=1 Tax=Sphingomonas sp. Leaf208 TaxID=1735679 RepID=UPI0006F9ED08|nr:molybdopterin cofactor-binding domain-containing protein [Sphingomonas sp. Leaf208]KQM55435.1 aldehyde dehydrogenase [Sphingomonas sp. Leaf208]